jgi:CBS domain-containing protein
MTSPDTSETGTGSMQVKDLMLPISATVQPDDALRDASDKIRSSNLDPIPVCEDRRLVGTLRESDIVALAERYGLATGMRRVREALRGEVFSLRADEDVSEAVDALQSDPRAKDLSRLPVVDGEGRLVGLVARRDLCQHDAGEAEPETAVSAVESISSLVNFDEDRVDFMSDASFPASDPIPPPSTMGPCPEEQK